MKQHTLDKVEVHSILEHLRLAIKDKVKINIDFILLLVHLNSYVFLYIHML